MRAGGQREGTPLCSGPHNGNSLSDNKMPQGESQHEGLAGSLSQHRVASLTVQHRHTGTAPSLVPSHSGDIHTDGAEVLFQGGTSSPRTCCPPSWDGFRNAATTMQPLRQSLSPSPPSKRTLFHIHTYMFRSPLKALSVFTRPTGDKRINLKG